MSITAKIDPLPYGQLSPNKVLRTDFTPGQAGRPLDMEWPVDFVIPTGNPIIDAFQNTHNMKYVETYEPKECIMDNIRPAPTILGTLTSKESEIATQEHWGANADHALSGSHVWKNTKNPENKDWENRSVAGYQYEP
jgi:hypothetical protein